MSGKQHDLFPDLLPPQPQETVPRVDVPPVSTVEDRSPLAADISPQVAPLKTDAPAAEEEDLHNPFDGVIDFASVAQVAVPMDPFKAALAESVAHDEAQVPGGVYDDEDHEENTA